jgi:hypothetical protein
MEKRLVYREDGSFKIVQFTDLHWENGNRSDLAARRGMERVLAEERPDLVVFTGDVIESTACADPKRSFRQAVDAAESSGTPWAAVFGNHDTEAGVTREELMELQREFRHCLSERGPRELTGVGNYVLRLAARDGRTDRALFFLDSGSYSHLAVGGYAAIARDQIAWYVRQSQALEAENGGPVPALLFFHIPLPEYKEAWERGTCFGSRHEEVCCPLINTGLFAAMVETGNAEGVFVGHDHANDYCGELYGIVLAYGRKTGYNNYNRKGMKHGARVIALEEGRAGFRTWLRLNDGSVERGRPAHRPKGRR